MPDPIFAHPRLARVYDAFDGNRDDLPTYLDIADELGAHRVLDIGCGTGCLALLLAGSRREVVGIDPAQASLDIAKRKDGAGRITWLHGDATTMRLPFVSFRYTYRFLVDDAVFTSDSTLRFRTRDEVERSLTAHGYRVLDVRDAPDRPGREFVFLAAR